MKKFKRIIKIICFQIGVNVIGLPEFHTIKFDLTEYQKTKSIHHA